MFVLRSAPPPASQPAGGLPDATRHDLATAHDDGEFREQAFFALVEHVRGWQPPPHSPADAGEPIRLAPDLNALTERPADFRGELCRISGELLQQTPLGPPYEGVSEWFVRDDRTAAPLVVYVVDVDAMAPTTTTAATQSSTTLADRQHVQIDARFYKRMRFAARDQKLREYAAFVGAFPIALATPASRPIAVTPHRGLDMLAILAGPMALLVIVFLGLRVWIARKNRAVRDRFATPAPWIPTASEVDDAAGLPDDPAEALAELKRRAETR